MNEAQVRHDLIDPVLRAAGWESLPAKVAVEQTIAPRPVSQEDGQSHNPEFADYVLMYGNRRIAVVEAKASDKNYRAGNRNILADQALDSFAFAEGDCYRLKAAVDNPPLDRIVYFTPYRVKKCESTSQKLTTGVDACNVRSIVLNDGVWTLSMKGFSDLLKQRYGSISEALSKLSFPTLDHALNYYSDIQHWLYAA